MIAATPGAARIAVVIKVALSLRRFSGGGKMFFYMGNIWAIGTAAVGGTDGHGRCT